MPTTVPSPHILFPKLPRHLLVHTTFSTTHTTTHTSLHTPRQHNITPSRSPLACRAVPCPAARPNQNTNNKKKPVFFPGTKETNPPSPITPLPCHTTEKNRTHGATPVQSDMDLGTPAGRPAFNHPPTHLFQGYQEDLGGAVDRSIDPPSRRRCAMSSHGSPAAVLVLRRFKKAVRADLASAGWARVSGSALPGASQAGLLGGPWFWGSGVGFFSKS